MDFVVAMRFFERNPDQAEAAMGNLIKYIDNMLSVGAKKVFVAVNVAEDVSGALNRGLGSEKIVIFPVQPWGKFVIPLTALLLMARKELANESKMLFASTEISATPRTMEFLFDQMDEKTLVVGARLPGHNYKPGTYCPANGSQVPWNTLALWNPRFLWASGFPLIGDGPLENPTTAGVEEMLAVGVRQQLYPFIDAKLIDAPGVKWNISDEKLAAHLRKIESKIERADEQAKTLPYMWGPRVIHGLTR